MLMLSRLPIRPSVRPLAPLPWTLISWRSGRPAPLQTTLAS